MSELSDFMDEYPKKEHFIPISYFLLVIFCILFLFVFDIKSPILFLALFGLTLPWSIIAGFFILGALHLGDDSSIVIIFLILAFINAYLLHQKIKPKEEIE